MSERPILFSTPMIQALLAGRKTVTRRAVKFPHQNPLGVWEPSTFGGPGLRDRRGEEIAEQPCMWHTREGTTILCPHGARGDSLWVRETWQHATQRLCSCPQPSEASPCDDWSNGTGCRSNRGEVVYAADGPSAPRWRPSIFMPRWASRIILRITDVRVERLQSISEADAKAEGVQIRDTIYPDEPRSDYSYVEQYRLLWDSINGDGAWQANPYVWVVSFERVATKLRQRVEEEKEMEA